MPRLLAVVVGAVLFFVVPLTLGPALGDDTPLSALAAVYGVCGAALGFLWPRAGWRLGLYLSAVWPPAFLFGMFLAGELLAEGRVDWAGTFRDAAGILLLLAAACFGAAAGAVAGRQRRAAAGGV